MISAVQSKLLFVSVFLLFCQPAYGTCLFNHVQVGAPFGIDGMNNLYVRNAGSAESANCPLNCTEFRFSDANADLDRVLGLLLAAKALGQKVRIDNVDETSCNEAFRIYINEN